MSTTNTPTEAAEQNSIRNNLIGKVTEWFSANPEPVQSDLDLDEMFSGSSTFLIPGQRTGFPKHGVSTNKCSHPRTSSTV